MKPYIERTVPELLEELRELTAAQPLPFPRALHKARNIALLLTHVFDAMDQAKFGSAGFSASQMKVAKEIAKGLDHYRLGGGNSKWKVRNCEN